MPKIIAKVFILFMSYLPCVAAYYFISNTGPTYFSPLENAVMGAFNDSDHMRENRLAREYLDSGANPNRLRLYGGTTLHTAAFRNNEELIKYLIEHGALINRKKCEDGETPLMVAAKNGNKKALSMLLKLGADKSVKSKSGKTAEEFSSDLNIKNILIYGKE